MCYGFECDADLAARICHFANHTKPNDLADACDDVAYCIHSRRPAATLYMNKNTHTFNSRPTAVYLCIVYMCAGLTCSCALIHFPPNGFQQRRRCLTPAVMPSRQYAERTQIIRRRVFALFCAFVFYQLCSLYVFQLYRWKWCA